MANYLCTKKSYFVGQKAHISLHLHAYIRICAKPIDTNLEIYKTMKKQLLLSLSLMIFLPHYSLCDLQISQQQTEPPTEEAYVTKKHEFHTNGAQALNQAGEYYQNRAIATKPVGPFGLFTREAIGGVILTYAGLLVFFTVLGKILGGNSPDRDFVPTRSFDPRIPQERIDDIAGKQPADFERVMDMLKNPSAYTRIGAKMPRSILLYGVPGTGKTVRARAVAGELNACFFEVSASSFMTAYQGSGSNNVEALFKKARAACQPPPITPPSSNGWFSWFKQEEVQIPEIEVVEPQQIKCVIFIDEIDAIGQHRSSMDPDRASQNPLYQLLIEMERPENEHIMVVAATNYKENLDDAFIRRFNAVIEIPLPDAQDLKEIFNLYVIKNAYPMSYEVHVDFHALSAAKFSGDDIKKSLETAAQMAGAQKKETLEQEHIDKALVELFNNKKKGRNR